MNRWSAPRSWGFIAAGVKGYCIDVVSWTFWQLSLPFSLECTWWGTRKKGFGTLWTDDLNLRKKVGQRKFLLLIVFGCANSAKRHTNLKLNSEQEETNLPCENAPTKMIIEPEQTCTRCKPVNGRPAKSSVLFASYPSSLSNVLFLFWPSFFVPAKNVSFLLKSGAGARKLYLWPTTTVKASKEHWKVLPHFFSPSSPPANPKILRDQHATVPQISFRVPHAKCDWHVCVCVMIAWGPTKNP